MNRLQGIAASQGIAFGRAHVVDRRRINAPKYHVEPTQVEDEVARFREAVTATDRQLQRIKEKLANVGGEAHTQILQAHQLILKDEHLMQQAIGLIQQERLNAEWALARAVSAIKEVFDKIENDYFRERRTDVAFVADQLMSTLTGGFRQDVTPPEDAVVVAPNLSPAETARFYRGKIRALVTDSGGRTSHTAIVARSLGIPAVVGLRDATREIGSGDPLIVDGYRGELIIDPTPAMVNRYRRRMEKKARSAEVLEQERSLPAETVDGVGVQLLANIELAEEIPSALTEGASGIGLYRTEFLYLAKDRPPTEEEHLQDALQVLRLCRGAPVTFRTCDLGADKVPGGAGGTRRRERNPALGMRSIRLCLHQEGLFRPQLRGLLRAAQLGGPLRLMFPMISGVEELRQARRVLNECRRELQEEGHQIPPVPVGVMIEMPSAAVTADLLAPEVDFFSIGTNDLTQYSLAIDRGNRRLNYLFRPYHPALLRLIHGVLAAAAQHDIGVSVCGEVAGDPLMTLLLVGLGVRELSMSAVSVPLVKRLVRSATLEEAREVAARVLALPTPQDVEAELLESMEDMFPHLSKTTFGSWDEDTMV